jgi:hypothetical protein
MLAEIWRANLVGAAAGSAETAALLSKIGEQKLLEKSREFDFT